MLSVHFGLDVGTVIHIAWHTAGDSVRFLGEKPQDHESLKLSMPSPLKSRHPSLDLVVGRGIF